MIMTARRKTHIFRVTGLSRDQSDEVLESSLKDTLRESFTAEERSSIRAEVVILPSCYDSNQERVALVQFHNGIPHFFDELIANPLGDWQVEMGNNDINFDCHFHGFTQLYTPTEEDSVVADIIAITGLDGHAYGSWRGKGNLGRMWLRDFLSKDLPRCRTMIYGYKSKLLSHGIDTILDYGRELMEEIKKIRNTKELQQRPLFFIAHSFGGIILAHCLVRAVQTMRDDHPAIFSLHPATYGILFFATPHKGLLVDDLQQMLASDPNHPRQHLLQQISSKSDVLIHQLADFKNLIRDRKIVSFHETEQTRKLVLDAESGKWKRKGDFVTPVGADSALLQLPDHTEDKVPLHADHSMIVKFDHPRVAGYSTALEKLRQFERDAPRVVAARFAQIDNMPQPSIMIPFEKDPFFVGREDILLEIEQRHKAIGQQPKRTALVGLAGVGKSQIAIEYSHRLRQTASGTWVFWVHASNVDRFRQGYEAIASVTKINGRNDPKANILQLVYQWLCDQRSGPWMMVLDNADHDHVFFDPHDGEGNVPLLNFVPQVAHGFILITSRNRLAAQNITGYHECLVEVAPMSEKESLDLLRAKDPISQSQVEEEKALVEALEYIPLAITQAGSYIANRFPRITTSQYLQLFHESEANQTHLLKHEDAKDLRRDPSIRCAVITTWQLSFEKISHERPAATELLALMSMFDRVGIPEDLVREGEDLLQFEDALAPLISYSLIRTEIKNQSFDMHRLVQLSVRAFLVIHEQLERWQIKSRAAIARLFPSGEYENWTQCTKLLPHAKEVIKSCSNDDTDQTKLAIILSSCGWYFRASGHYDEAVEMNRKALAVRERVLGFEHPDTLNSVNSLGIALVRQGNYEESEAMHRRNLASITKFLGPKHPSRLTSLENLGGILHSRGKYKEAESRYLEVLRTKEEVYGLEHASTLISLGNLATVLTRLGKSVEAETMYRQALKFGERLLGLEHPDTLTIVNNLGTAILDQGSSKEAEILFRRALISREKVLGCEHPDTLISLDYLAVSLSEQKRYEETEEMYRTVLNTREKVLGSEHPQTLISLNNLALSLSEQGKNEKAEMIQRQVIHREAKLLGPEHPDALISISNLGVLLRRQGKCEEAESMHRQVLSGREQIFGIAHKETIASMDNLALTLACQEKFHEAEELYRQSLVEKRKLFGSQHPDTLLTIDGIGILLKKQGKCEEAEVTYQQDLEKSGI